ncbi:MAG TPA: FecR domain-containing protein [Opitutaceae bacterium]|nr:FecR domain-containing protein [Opitutaceae bacterium]
MPDEPHSFEPSPIEETASAWLARRDRELTAAEQDDYLHWLRQDPRHGRAIARLGKTWNALDTLAKWRPEHSRQPNPDLLARPSRAHGFRRNFAGPLMVAAAAAVVIGIFVFNPAGQDDPAPASRGVRVIPRPERLALTDGSVVELNDGGKIETDFTEGERRVRLVRGEAHFTVAKNAARPFIVEVGTVAVRAIGTAFEVRRGAAEVEVLVTEGKVHVERPAAAGLVLPATPLIAGERAVVDTTPRAQPPLVSPVSEAEIERRLAWQGVRLEFAGLPLAEVLAEFNLRNPNRVIVADAETGRLRVGGTFRADNVDAFVRLLEASFGVTAKRQPDGTTLLLRAK